MALAPGVDYFLANLRRKDPHVLHHAQRAACYAGLMGSAMGLRGAQLMALEVGGLLHDLGKLSIPHSILEKSSSLDDNEWDVVRQHPAAGHAELVGRLDESSLDVVLYHHERFDGHGYPRGLKGTDIPVVARIFCIADAFDAMTSDRPSRKPLSLQEARDEILRCAGTQFDPVLVQVFLAIFDDVARVYCGEDLQGQLAQLEERIEAHIPVAHPVLVPRPL
jgi:HD-GYP domain-containing protein (c-di-GMP phosphodiesterase class II)